MRRETTVSPTDGGLTKGFKNLFKGAIGLLVGGSIFVIYLASNVGGEIEDGKYATVSYSFFALFMSYLGLVLLLTVTLHALLYLSNKDFSESVSKLSKYLSLYIVLLIFCAILVLVVNIWQSGTNEKDIDSHNDALTIEKLETAYDSPKKISDSDDVLDNIPDSGKISNAQPYLAKKDGEEYVLYVSIDKDKNTADVITETKVDDTKPVKSL